MEQERSCRTMQLCIHFTGGVRAAVEHKETCRTTHIMYTSQLALEPRLNTKRLVEQRIMYTFHRWALGPEVEHKKTCRTTQIMYTSQLALEPRLNTEGPVEQCKLCIHFTDER
jgi:hypothetical protein